MNIFSEMIENYTKEDLYSYHDYYIFQGLV